MHSGSCLCGAVAYEIDELPGPAVCCHCHTCRKSHGSAFKVGAAVRREHFRWTRGEGDALRGFESSPGKLRHFCGICGSHLASIRDTVQVALALATLDTDPGFGPVAHIWTSDKASWFEPDPRLPSHEAGIAPSKP